MTGAVARAVLNCGATIALARSKGFGAEVRAAVATSKVPLHLLDGRFSAQATAVVVPNPSVQKGIVRQAAEARIPVLSEQEALSAIELLNTAVAPGWCDCAKPIVPSTMVRTWEDHRLGACGWPERRCDTPEHRKSWVRPRVSPSSF